MKKVDDSLSQCGRFLASSVLRKFSCSCLGSSCVVLVLLLPSITLGGNINNKGTSGNITDPQFWQGDVLPGSGDLGIISTVIPECVVTFPDGIYSIPFNVRFFNNRQLLHSANQFLD